MTKGLKLYDTELAECDIPWSSNYNTIEVNPDDLTELLTLVFHGQIANKALYQGHSVQIFNWDINIERVCDNVVGNSRNERFIITMPDGMPGIIASEVYELLKSHNIGLIYHL
jgi:hypothetical protein